MDDFEFTKRIQELGKLKKRPGPSTETGYVDRVFVPTDQPPPCPNCLDKGRLLVYQRKWTYKGRAYWQTKCGHCKTIWEELRF